MAHAITSASAPAGPSPQTTLPPPSPPPPAHTQSQSQSQSRIQYESIVRPSPPQANPLDLHRTVSSISHHDMPCIVPTSTGDLNPIYSTFSPGRKHVIVAVVSFCGFLAPVSSTTVLSAVPEVAATFGTDGSVVNVSNALYMLFMGISPCFYGPCAGIWGRKWVCLLGSIACSRMKVP